jgi:serine/threonine protein kinase
VTILTGRRLGPYEIVTQAGSGEMGEVYRARDTRLNHGVAMKALPEGFAIGPKVQRDGSFERIGGAAMRGKAAVILALTIAGVLLARSASPFRCHRNPQLGGTWACLSSNSF